jgi:hypothetical protein
MAVYTATAKEFPNIAKEEFEALLRRPTIALPGTKGQVQGEEPDFHQPPTTTSFHW